MNPNLNKPLSKYGKTSKTKGEPAKVDRTGGKFGGGLISGYAVITRGEALGHEVWIDQAMLSQVANGINSTGTTGIKSRFTHPGLSSDGMGKFLGRTMNASIDGDVVRADLHLSDSAHSTPDGNLASYVMDLAESDPEAFGASIVFSHDREAEASFEAVNGGDSFQSPDPLNKANFPHARVKELHASDVVDEPAANPSGLFHRGDEIATEAESLVAYALGMSSDKPQVASFDIDPDRVSGFVQRFLDRHGITLVHHSKGFNMPDENKPADETPVVAEQQPSEVPPVEEVKPEEPVEEVMPEVEPEDKPEEKPQLSEGQKFLEAFGDIGGRWFAEGKSFAQAQELYTKALKAGTAALQTEVAELKKQLTALRGESAPVSFSPPPAAEVKVAGELSNKVGPNLAKFAAGLGIAK